ncbi:GTP 3',8-cyclase MoaA [Niallia circulans]|uniref:GTP 3',8-cyclase MoaA n=1 Tax=Niallia circulans TaxID=1397 RepID=UPI000BA5ED9A|nr:GTP 3',8-cyclase MoaA [Niallia circulans]PAD88514.1 GTP 3',8-cyclase MoaA [Niallia circulans]
MLQDRLGRPLQDLRISVIDRCNFRCTYCMPREIFGKDFSFLPKDQLLSFEEIERLAKLFVQLGVRKIRLTGGEPLLRRDIATLIEKLAAIDGLEDIGLTTNGILLGKMAKSLKQAGLERVNVSLDALDDKVFQSINDSGIPTKKILDSIEQARKAGLSVKVNMVVKKGMNDQQVIPMAKYFKEQEIPLRYIEFMDVGQTNGWDFSQVITKKQLFEQLSQHFELEPVDSAYIGEVAKRYRYVGTNAEVGFITSVSESFCSTCTRARLAADGKFYTCLFASGGLDLRTLLRFNADDQTILQSIVPTWKNRNDRYSDERTEESAKHRKKMEMSYIGG